MTTIDVRGWAFLVAMGAGAYGCGARSTGPGGLTTDDVPAPVDGSAPDGPGPTADAPGPDVPATDAAPACARAANVDLLFMVDNSNSMSLNQGNLARSFRGFLDRLTSPASGTGAASVRVGVISSDLGTPGSVVPSCANSDVGDDGRLNPIRNGLAIRTHQPWYAAPAGARPARCTNDPNQYPAFLGFDASTTDAAEFRDDFVCNAYLSGGGCGLEQQLESAYRALVTHDARERAGNTSPNAGFVRDDAVLGVMFFTDEEDTSVRDCRFAEAGVGCTDGVGVFDVNSTEWASSDLNLRGYLYAPGSAQDPTWPIDRYVDPARPNRGFLSLKPGRPELVVIGAIAGVPLDPPAGSGSAGVDWDALLGRNPDGSDGYTGMSSGGPVSMRQGNPDPMCTTRVTPSCRREGSSPVTACDVTSQYFAWPSRRVAQVVRRVDERYGNGVLGSICRNDYGETLGAFADRLTRRFCAR